MTHSLLDLSLILKRSKKVCVFGMGTYFNDCFDQICLVLGRKPDYVSDNAEAKWGIPFKGIECISPNQIEALSDELTVVVTVRQYEAIYQQLIRLGVRNILLMNFERGFSHVSNFYDLSALNNIKPKQLKIENISGKRALVTGASRGIGFQIAIALAELGVNLVVHSRQQMHNKKVIDACLTSGVEVTSIEANLADAAQLENMLKQLPDIDILINSAGISLECNDYWQLSNEDFIETLQVNTVAPILLANKLIPKMVARGYGRVVNVSSTIQYRPYEMTYACSKAALDKYVHDIVPSLVGTGVKLSLLDPGWLKTDMGGEHAIHDVTSVLPGAILGVVINEFENGRWFSAQDYAGYELEKAVAKVESMSSNLM